MNTIPKMFIDIMNNNINKYHYYTTIPIITIGISSLFYIKYLAEQHIDIITN